MNDHLSRPIGIDRRTTGQRRWHPGRRHAEGQSAYGAEEAGVGREHGLTVMTEADVAHRVSSSSGPTIYDRSALRMRLLGDEGLLEALQDAFLEEVPQLIEKLRNALVADAPVTAGLNAHTIKRASANVGAEALHELVLAVEQAGQEGDLGSVQGVMADIDTQFDLVRRAMLATT